MGAVECVELSLISGAFLWSSLYQIIETTTLLIRNCRGPASCILFEQTRTRKPYNSQIVFRSWRYIHITLRHLAMALLKPWLKAELEFILQFSVGGCLPPRRTRRQTKKQHVQCVEVDVKHSGLRINDSNTLIWCFVSKQGMKTVRKVQVRAW